jgi:hypothetical protein
MSKRITSWYADRHGIYQGTPTAGQALDWLLTKIGKRRLPHVEAIAKAWPTWAEGKVQPIDDDWLNAMMRDGQLPGRNEIQYSCVDEDKAERGEHAGRCAIVETLDATTQTRHRLKMHGLILVAAPRDKWDASKIKAAA